MTTKKKPDYAALLEARLQSKARRAQRVPIGLKPELWGDVTAAREAYDELARNPHRVQVKMNQTSPLDKARKRIAEAEAAYRDASIMLVFEARTPAEDRAIMEAALIPPTGNDEDETARYDIDLHAQLIVQQSLSHAEDHDGNHLDVPLDTLKSLVRACDAGEFARMRAACHTAASVDFLSSQR